MIKKFIKKIGKGIRTGLKSIGKAFKKAFKGIGKFIGKLGPIGMLGMMLIMPQMASWWGSFGKWAGTLGKGFGTVMRGVHKAGTLVGKAYSTVTDTISGTMNKITGGSFARPGGEGLFAGEYVEGASDKLANWMSSTMDSAREGLGLETAGGGVPSSEVDVDISTDVSTDVPTVDAAGNPISAADQETLRNLSTPGYNVTDGTVLTKPTGVDIYEGLPSADQAALLAQRGDINKDLQYSENFGKAIGVVGGLVFDKLFN